MSIESLSPPVTKPHWIKLEESPAQPETQSQPKHRVLIIHPDKEASIFANSNPNSRIQLSAVRTHSLARKVLDRTFAQNSPPELIIAPYQDYNGEDFDATFQHFTALLYNQTQRSLQTPYPQPFQFILTPPSNPHSPKYLNFRLHTLPHLSLIHFHHLPNNFDIHQTLADYTQNKRQLDPATFFLQKIQTHTTRLPSDSLGPDFPNLTH